MINPNEVTKENVREYYSTVPHFDLYLVLRLIGDDPTMLAEYEVWMKAQSAITEAI